MCGYARMWFSVFTNWTGIVVEVKRGQLKGEEGGVGGIYESSSSLHQKKAYRVDKH